MKKGFTLIEMVIAVAISGVVATALYMLLHQTQRTVSSVMNITTADAKLITAYQQLQRDLTGAFAPPNAWPRRAPTQQKQPEKPAPQQDTKPEQKKEAAASKPDDTPGQITEQSVSAKAAPMMPPEINNVFVYTAKNGMLSNFTFLSHNPLSVYSDPEQASSSIRAVRIMYSLKPSVTDPDSNILMRQESSVLDVKNFSDTKKIRAYELVHGIKTISCQFMYEPSSEEKEEQHSSEQDQERQSEKKEVKRFKTIPSWSSDELVQKQLGRAALIPSYVHIKIEFAQTTIPLEFLVPIEGPGSSVPGTGQLLQPPKPAEKQNGQQAGKQPASGNKQVGPNQQKVPITPQPQRPIQAPRGGQR